MTIITGVSFPIPKKYIARFFSDNKTVFIKPATCFKEIKPGMKFIFYQSHEDTGYVGEATIRNIQLSEHPLDLYNLYKDEIFLSKQEIEAYEENLTRWKSIRVRKDLQKKRLWMVIVLDEIIQYVSAVKPKRFVAVGGQYIRE